MANASPRPTTARPTPDPQTPDPQSPGRRNPLGSLRRLAVIAAAVVLGVTMVPTSASATTFPETWLADSAGHAYCYTSTFDNFPEHRTRVSWAMDRLDDQTDMSDIAESCVSGTDVYWYRIDLPAGTRGQASCVTWTSGGRCNSADIDMDFPELNIGDNDVEDQQKTALHELGHTVGLGHHSPSAHDCAMVSGELPSLATAWRSLHSHDVSHINATY